MFPCKVTLRSFYYLCRRVFHQAVLLTAKDSLESSCTFPRVRMVSVLEGDLP